MELFTELVVSSFAVLGSMAWKISRSFRRRKKPPREWMQSSWSFCRERDRRRRKDREEMGTNRQPSVERLSINSPRQLQQPSPRREPIH